MNWQKLACWWRGHIPDQQKIFNRSGILSVYKEPMADCGIQLAKSICRHCGKKIDVKRRGWFGVTGEWIPWERATKEDLRMVDFLRKRKE